MAPTDYLSVKGIGDGLQYLKTTYAPICHSMTALAPSILGQSITGIRIAGGTRPDRRGVLLIAGVHARELINPDLLIFFSLKLCQAYTKNTGLTFGGKSYSASIVKLIVDNLDLFILPLVNPDGRAWVQSPTGYAMWRKNRRTNPGSSCLGVDLNRNFDFLWASGIGTSASACSDVYKGSGAMSEPEVQNIRTLLDTYPNIGYFVDIHSYSELILYPWGDDENQTTTPEMNFRNPAYDARRGRVPDDPAHVYKEYIPEADRRWFVTTGERIRTAIAAVRGRSYTLQQSVGLYPTSATSDDYAYARHFVDASKRKVRGMTIETATEFQPAYSEATQVMQEVAAGLMEYCIASVCATETILRTVASPELLTKIREFRDQEFLKYPFGQQWVALFDNYAAEINTRMAENETLRKNTANLLLQACKAASTYRDASPKVVDPDLVLALDQLFNEMASQGTVSLKKDMTALRNKLVHFKGKTVLQGLKDSQRH